MARQLCEKKYGDHRTGTRGRGRERASWGWMRRKQDAWSVGNKKDFFRKS